MSDGWGRTLVVLGDSFTVGEGDPTGHGWVGPIVAAARRALPEPTTVYALGVCGDVTADVERRWRAELTARARTRTVTHVLVAVGTNDAWALRDGDPARRAELAGAMTAGLARIVGGVAAQGPTVALVGIPPLPEDEGDREAALLDEAFAAWAQARGVRRFDLRARLDADPRWARALASAPDGIHPDAEGYAAWADALLDQDVVAWLDRPRAAAVGG